MWSSLWDNQSRNPALLAFERYLGCDQECFRWVIKDSRDDELNQNNGDWIEMCVNLIAANDNIFSSRDRKCCMAFKLASAHRKYLLLSCLHGPLQRSCHRKTIVQKAQIFSKFPTSSRDRKVFPHRRWSSELSLVSARLQLAGVVRFDRSNIRNWMSTTRRSGLRLRIARVGGMHNSFYRQLGK